MADALTPGRNVLSKVDEIRSRKAELQVPSAFVNRLIGRRGSNLSRLREETGAVIRVSASGRGGGSGGGKASEGATAEAVGERGLVRITGEPKAVDKAKRKVGVPSGGI